VASNISQDKFFNIQSNPNLDAADTGVDSSGKILSKEERKAIFRRRRINPKKVFGGSGAIVKVDKSPNKTPMGALIKSVSNIQNTVQRITNFIATDAEKEKEQQRQDQRDQFVQDDKDRKKKKEGLLEGIGKSIGKSLLKPVEAVGKNVKGILGRLGDAFMAIFGGFIANKGIKMIQAKMSGDTDTFKKMRNEMIKGLAVVGGIFLALNGGLLALPLIIKGVALAVIKIGAAILAFLASPAGLIALGIAAGIGVLFAVNRRRKDVNAALDSNKQMLRDAGIKAYKKDGARVMRNGKEVFVKTEDLTEGERSAREAFEIEQQRVKNVTKDKNKAIQGTFDRVTNERESMSNPEWASIMAVEDLDERSKLISQFRKDTQNIVKQEKKEIRAKFNSKYSQSGNMSPTNVKNNISTLEESKPEVIDTTTNSGGGNMVSGGNDELATSLPNISSSNSDNKFTLYSQTQYNMVM
tara:strand:- start:763 stop:2166 length:1404 start_codon:yes stop_codon:yes gene_type:complete